jgi:predicted transposase/invertase (TIGR01784 family)
MARYLDPKADVTFKKVFGEHPHLLKHFLNAVLPLQEREIVELIYLPSESAPRIPGMKRTIADVRCTDNEGRIFIVEMQIQWVDSFKQRLLFEGCQAFVKQLGKGEDYDLLEPVYGLGLVATTFDPTDTWYHHYQLVNRNTNPVSVIEHLQLVFIELPKFPVESKTEKRLRLLWLRFMREIDQTTRVIPPELLAVPEIEEALDLLEESAYTEAELSSYDSYWDAVSTEKTLLNSSKAEGLIEGKAEGLIEGEAKGLIKGKAEGQAEEQHRIAQKMLQSGVELSIIQACTGLSVAVIKALSK